MNGDLYISIPAVAETKQPVFTKKEWKDFGLGLTIFLVIAVVVIILGIVFLIFYK